MGDLETSLIHARKACRIEQMVAKWLHRSRDSTPRSSVAAMDSAGDGAAQPPSRAKVTVTVYKDLVLQHYGFEICPSLPLTIASVTAGSTADGKLQPGDQLLAINSSAVDSLSVERAASLIRDAGDELLLTVLRCAAGGPKSSFLTEEKRARLKSNPVKVRFAEEVLLNGHSQGSSLLFMPNVLKVYLENGQTKAFRFERSTTVKDIVLTLQEKLSIRSIAHFALALEEQYSLAKIHLLHEEELIAQVVQKRDSHDYRCLFRVCFVPRDPLELLQEDPVAFEYLYLQSCSDVLQERFAVEMKCSVALRLAALHIQERISACAQPQKVSLKYIERDWGIENFISPTLLRNMRGKDIKKAISYHLKRNQVLLDPRQKHAPSAAQVRLSYLQILGELKMYSGMIFNATMMLQDRESYVALLVGAKHGVSQIVNSKLNIVSSLAEFPSISRVELSEDSERVSTVKIYLQDLKVLTLLLESNSAKDLVCLIAGYYRLLVDANASVFSWGEKKQQLHRVSAEEGYESRACSDSEDSWELDPRSGCAGARGGDPATDSASEASDSATSESRGVKTSGSSDSVDALEEEEGCSSSRPELLPLCAPTARELSGSPGSSVPLPAAGTGDCSCLRQVSGGRAAPGPRLPAAGLGGASPGRGSGHGDLVLRPPPGFGDSSSEEEFYDAADRLSPPEALAGHDTASREGAEDSSCIPKRLRCHSLGENPSTGEKQGQEKGLACSKSLRKRRSFLKTDYTSQVSFPAAVPGSPQRCCSWPPTQPSAEDPGKDEERGIPAAPQAQGDPAGTEPCSAAMDAEPDAAGTNSVMEWLASPPLDLHHPAGQRGEEASSPQPQHPALLSLEPLPRGQGGAAQEGCPGQADPGGQSEDSLVPSAVASRPVEPLLPPPAPGPSTASPREPARGQGLPPARVEPSLAACPESKGGGQSCGTGCDNGQCRADGQCHADSQGSASGQCHADGQCHDDGQCLNDGQFHADAQCRADSQGPASSSCEGAVPQARVVPGEAQCRLPEGLGGFPGAARLLADRSSASGALSRLSWLSLGVRTQPVSPSPMSPSPVSPSPVSPSLQDTADDPPEIFAGLATRGCSGAGAGGGKVPPRPAGAGSGQERASSSEPGAGQPGGAGSAAQPQPQPAQASPPREQPAGLGPRSCPPPPAGLCIPSVPAPPGKGAAGRGAARHPLLCFNPEEGEQTPLPPSAAPPGLDSCGCRLPYISCFPQPRSPGEREASPPQLPGPLTSPPCSSLSLAGSPGSGVPAPVAGDAAGQDPHLRVLGQLKDQAWTSPADFSRFLAHTVELQEVVGKLCGSQATHLHHQCAEQGVESKGALGWASRDLLSSCQALLSAEQPLTEVQRALRATFDRLVQLAVTCFQVSHCRRCRQRQQELGAALGDVVGSYQQLVQAVHQQLHGQVCPELGSKLLARQHTALAAAILCLLQQFRPSPWL
ncbi:FERM and PDZ domain-containing protein 1 [Motacilla alba alba]|uniref:FERM and PDZ domain-containing protein 1 n=1 Tax=Motacilla alba alba TaxID=1094192 RepID=UPI0018D5906C|nr:FERM and PDZ domain-containing protein 1 [Motacilla alba alba]